MNRPTETRTTLYDDWLNLRLHLFWCYENKIGQDQFPSNSVQTFSQYDNSGAWLIRKGWAKVEYDGQQFIAMPGQWMILKPCKRVQSFAPGTEGISISYQACWPDGSHLFDKGLCTVIDADDFPSLEKKARPIAKAVKKFAPNSWDARTHVTDLKGFLNIQALLSNWLIELEKCLKDKAIEHSGQFGIDERVMSAVRILNTQKLSQSFNINDLAEAVFLSPNHLIRLFHENLQKSPAQYYEKILIEEAKNRLQVPDSRIKEISIELGFRHLSHFSKWFKKHTGQSPREFKKPLSQ
ncbi:Helix-turn-helix, AraC type [Lentisphaera araneosa HTCC2155]|uniref:Helix-turn-helix, AraC type n=1 Tax=Lentisphaera araneosa HTCC2155 TaxID=313628 RepID=A6DPV4_9BACT|nr:helix-turn-helix transcriptional regulator [Lentisphaera araneosa]EDM26399.1 Helix-turn-helix, AraC type [Lentisphaera araneosa HTCC2155]